MPTISLLFRLSICCERGFVFVISPGLERKVKRPFLRLLLWWETLFLSVCNSWAIIQYIKHKEECLPWFPNSEKLVEKRGAAEFFFNDFQVFGYLTKHSFECLMQWSNIFLLCTFQLHQQGILRTDDLITRFFRISTELCVEVTYRALGDNVSLLIYFSGR